MKYKPFKNLKTLKKLSLNKKVVSNLEGQQANGGAFVTQICPIITVFCPVGTWVCPIETIACPTDTLACPY